MTVSVGKAHPDDVLIVAWLSEKKEWPEFQNGQVVPVASAEHGGLRGRKVRHIYQTTPAIWHMTPRAMVEMDVLRAKGGGEIRWAKDWRPEPEPTRWQKVRRFLLDLCERFG